jgi:hypothetical protein
MVSDVRPHPRSWPEVDERLLPLPEGRHILTELDPLLFTLVYLPHHLRGPETAGAYPSSETCCDDRR